MRIRTLLCAALLLASGCGKLISVYNDHFQCPIAQGDGPCQSLSNAYATATAKTMIPEPPDPGRLTPPATTNDDWVPPVKTIWIAPYVDAAGRRHEPAVMRLVVLPGPPIVKPEPEFLIPPVPEVTDEGSTIGPPVPPADYGTSQAKPGRQPQQPPAGGFSIPGF